MRFDEMPPIVSGMRSWGANVGGLTFVISHEDGAHLRPEDREAWTGYTASYRDRTARRPTTIRIDGRWERFVDAEKACRDTWRSLRNKQ